MIQAQTVLTATAPAQGLREVTEAIRAWVEDQTIVGGLLTIFIRHTSASILIQENYDPEVQRDLEAFLNRLAPEDVALYTHIEEGPDDMPAHIKSALTQTHLAIPVRDGRLLLGRYQGIYLFEHRRQPRERELALHLIGESG